MFSCICVTAVAITKSSENESENGMRYANQIFGKT